MRHSFLRIIWFTCVVCHCWLIEVPIANAEPQKDEHQRPVETSSAFSLRSDPLPTPITFLGDPQSAQVTTIEAHREDAGRRYGQCRDDVW